MKTIIRNSALLLILLVPGMEAFAHPIDKTKNTDSIFVDLSVVQADSLINANAGNPNFIIIDVRTPAEYNAGYIQNAININYYASNFSALIDTLNKSKRYLVYCGSGVRSAKARDTMKVHHFQEVYNMLGGFSAWKADSLPYIIPNGIAETSKAQITANIFPNPVTDVSFIEIEGINATNCIAEIYDMYGRMVKRIIPSAGNKIAVNHDELSPGIYLYRLTVNEKYASVGKFEID